MQEGSSSRVKGDYVEAGDKLSSYFPPDSKEYKIVMSDWSSWVKWRAGRRRTKRAEDWSRIPQEQPEYRNSFFIKMNNDIGDIIFRKAIIFQGENKKNMTERRHGILQNFSGYHLTV